MENTEKVKYQKAAAMPQRLREIAALAAGWAVVPAAFLGGSVSVLNSFTPLPLAITSVFFLDGARFYACAGAALLGLLTTGRQDAAVKYIAALLLAVILNLVAGRILKNLSLIYKAAMGGVCVFAGGVLLSISYGGSQYVLFIAGVEAIMVFGSALVLSRGTEALCGRRSVLSGDEIFSISVLAGIAAAAPAAYGSAGALAMCAIASAVSLLTAYRSGVGAGAACAAAIGLVLITCGRAETGMFAAFTVAAVFAGLLREAGKLGAVAGYMLGLGFFTFIMRFTPESISMLSGGLAGGAAFLGIPASAFRFMDSIRDGNAVDGNRYYAKMRETINSGLEDFSSSFHALSSVMSEGGGRKPTAIAKQAKEAAGDVFAGVCAACGLNNYCWEENYDQTASSFYSAFKACVKRGRAEERDMPAEFVKKCAKIKAFTSAVQTSCVSRRRFVIWENKLNESRALVSRIFKAACEMSDSIAESAAVERSFREDLENDIRAAMEREGLAEDGVTAAVSRSGEYTIIVNGEYGKEEAERIIALASKAAGRKLRREPGNAGARALRLIEAGKLKAAVEFSFKPKDGQSVSGDTYSYMELKNGGALIALSDGMGAGNAAGSESRAAVELLEKLADSGFRGTTSVELINSLLLLRSDEESFATLDICLLDLYGKKARFIKSGAAASFLIRGKKAAGIRSKSLPAGIISGIDADSYETGLKNGDVIIMMTDGISDAAARRGITEEEWLENIFIDFWSNNPKDLSDYVLAEALKLTGGKAADDMTVMAARVWQTL